MFTFATRRQNQIFHQILKATYNHIKVSIKRLSWTV